MKKLFHLCLLVHFFSTAQVINWDTALSQIYQPSVGFEAKKILLDKTTSFADLYNFNDSNHNNSDAIHFKQALSELYNASNKQYFNNYNNFPNFNTEIKNATSIPIGIISTKCAYLHYDEENNSNGNLSLSNGVFYPINSTIPSFMEKDLLIVSPLYPAFTSNTDTFTFSINQNQWYQYINNIKKLEANFGDGVFRTFINNGVVLATNFSANIPIPYATIKKQNITFRVTFNNNSVKNTTATILLTKIVTPNVLRTSNCATSQLLKHRSNIIDNSGVFGEVEYKVLEVII